MNEPQSPRRMPREMRHDVIVIGGGVAGCAAALAARRNGYSVLLLEKNCQLGGLATCGLVNLFVPLCNGNGVPIVRGMAEEFLRMSIRHGYDTLNDAWRDGPPATPTHLRYATFFSPHIFAMQLLERLRNEGVDLLFDAVFEDPVCEGGSCRGVTALCEEGVRFFPAEAVIDASGASLVFARAQAPTQLGDNYFSSFGYAVTLESCADAIKKNNIRHTCRWQQGGEADLYGKKHPEKLPLYHGDTSGHVTDYLVATQLHLLQKLKSTPRTARDLPAMPGMPQLRTIRRIRGEYTLREDDIYRHFDDSVTAVGDSERRDSLYEIPFRTMYHRDFHNLIAAGRNISADGYMWDVTRVIPPAIVTGQAAGCAAAICCQRRCRVAEIPRDELQRLLRRGGVLLHFDDAWIPDPPRPGEYSPASHSHPDYRG